MGSSFDGFVYVMTPITDLALNNNYSKILFSIIVNDISLIVYPRLISSALTV